MWFAHLHVGKTRGERAWRQGYCGYVGTAEKLEDDAEEEGKKGTYCKGKKVFMNLSTRPELIGGGDKRRAGLRKPS